MSEASLILARYFFLFLAVRISKGVFFIYLDLTLLIHAFSVGEHTLTLNLSSWTLMIAFNSENPMKYIQYRSCILNLSMLALSPMLLRWSHVEFLVSIADSALPAVAEHDNWEDNCFSLLVFILIGFDADLCHRGGMFQSTSPHVYLHC